MTNVFKIVSAAALTAAMAMPAVAGNVPLNTTVSGGQGVENVDGQAVLGLGALGASGAALAALGLVVVVTVVADNDNTSTSTP